MTANSSNIETKIANTAMEYQAVARLRYEVFARELGASGGSVDHAQKIERDMFDDHANHLIAIDRTADDAVVGVNRLLTRDMADKAGGFYSEGEFDLSGLKASGRNLLELGRSCVHPNYRGGTTMFQLWQGLAEYVLSRNIDILFGVASFHGVDPTEYSHALSNLAENYSAPKTLQARSRHYQEMRLIGADHIDRKRAVQTTPALIKSYLRLGGVVGDGAFVDHAFNTIDVCLIMDTQKMSDRHRAIYSKAALR